MPVRDSAWPVARVENAGRIPYDPPFRPFCAHHTQRFGCNAYEAGGLRPAGAADSCVQGRGVRSVR